MNNREIIVLYQSETGFTKRYAQWIAEELHCTCTEEKEASLQMLTPYQVIIYGGGFYAGAISGLKKWKDAIEKMQGKKLIVFVTGASPMENEESIAKAIEQNVSKEEQEHIPVYYFRGGLNYSEMSVKSKCIMKAFCFMMDRKKNKTPEEQAMAQGIKTSFDESRREYIYPLIESVKSM